MSMKAATFILDDTECVRILSDEGLLNALAPQPKSRCKAVGFTRDGCSCIAMHFFGFPESKDNGYQILMVPTTNETEQRAAARFFSELIEKELSYGDPIDFFRIPPVSVN